MSLNNFYLDVIRDYENNLDVFFDVDTGAVYEPGREDGAPKFLFTEVTGYAILDFLLLHAITGNPSYVERAERSANWIMNHAQDPTGGVLTRYYFEHDASPKLEDKSFKGRRIFSFDVGICLRGMVAIYRQTENPEYLASARRMGDYILNCVLHADGRMDAIYDAGKGAALTEEPDKWSRAKRSFHTKVAEALIDLYAATQDEKYLASANSICDAAIKFQSNQGNFETSKGLTELHPHGYATEGLLHVGRMTRNQTYIDSARRATEWALSKCTDGEIAQSFEYLSGNPLTRFRTDALAQVLALASDLHQMGQLDEKYLGTMAQLAKKILSMKTAPGGYYRYGYYEKAFNGKIEADTRCYWANMFCLRGFSKYYFSQLLNKTYVVLLAGGIGSRVWPISCENRPKPVSYSLLGDRSLLQECIRRYTHDYFIRPDRVFILCSRNALEEASRQAEREGIPKSNCVIEHEPKGTVPAVAVAMAGLPVNAAGDDRYIVISMTDNVIDPYEHFQHAVMAALCSVREKECIVSVGKPFDSQTVYDHRFGHHRYNNKIDCYRAYEVEEFAEKPDAEQFAAMKSRKGDFAWECGTVIFSEKYYRKCVPANPASGNLAEDVLARARPWAEQSPGQINLATALLNENTRFEDFGVPGTSVRNFYHGHPRHDFGNGNVCLGDPGKVRMLSCRDNLVISDEIPIEIYGLDNCVVIDNAVTNTAVILPIDEVEHLPNLYRLFSGSRAYEPYIKGGAPALSAEPTTFVEKSPHTNASSDYGLLFVYKIKANLRIERSRKQLRIINNTYPDLDKKDFEILHAKQHSDAKLCEHLVDVGAVANALVGGDLQLSNLARSILNKLCIYHAIGGFLKEEEERKEQEAISEFRKSSKLNRRMLDSRIIIELLCAGRSDVNPGDQALVRILNDNVNSAVQFIRSDSVNDNDVRDLIVALIQGQDAPYLYNAFKKDLGKAGLGELEREVDRIFACFKVAKNIANGRWLWKRSKYSNGRQEGQILLQHNIGRLEDIPFIIGFTIKWLLSAQIDPAPFVNRVNELFRDERSTLVRLIGKLQQGEQSLLCDQIYRYLLLNGIRAKERLYDMVSSGINEIRDRGALEYYQFGELLELPMNLELISHHCDAIDAEIAASLKDVVADLYHHNWKLIKPYVSAERIANLGY